MKSRSIPAILLSLALILSVLVFPLSVFADDPTPEPVVNPTRPEAPELPEKEAATAFADSDVATAFESGSGEWNNPYLIKTAGQWMYFAKQVNEGTTFEGKYFALDGDIDFGNRILTPVGVGDKPFKGVLNGKGHTLSNFEIALNEDDATVCGAPLGRTVGAVIKNLTVSDARIHMQGKGNYAAGVVAFAIGSTVSACKTESNVLVLYENASESTDNNSTAGGIVGSASESAKIVNCFNQATVIATKPVGLVFAGGVVGSMGAATVSECRNSGYIRAGVSGGWFDAGGIVGRMGISSKKGKIENCMNTGTVVSSQQAGGIVGTINAALCEINNNLSNNVVFANRDWSGLLIGRWSGLLVYASGNRYVQTTDPGGMGENSVTLISAGVGARTSANPTSGSTGLIQGNAPTETITADAFAESSVEWINKFNADFDALVAKAEENPQSADDPIPPSPGTQPPSGEITTKAPGTKQPSGGTATTAPSSTKTGTEKDSGSAKKAKKGCKSTVGGAIVVLAALPMAALTIRKKKEN